MASTACLDPRRKLCKCTASRLGDALASLGYTSSGFYVKQLRGLVPPTQMNEFMQAGLELEPVVAEAYSAFTGNDVELLGFGVLPEDPRFGASPDYITTLPDGSTVLLEIKTTQRKDAFLAWMFIPITHLLQMLGQCAVHDRDSWCSHYACYHTQTEQYYLMQVQFDSSLWYDDIFPLVVEFMDFVESGRPIKQLRRSAQTKLDVTNLVLDKITVTAVPSFF
jgi:hypothetical protein